MEHYSLDSLGELQKRTMEIIWDLGEATVHDVRERLPRRKPLAYTTVLSVMQKLEKGGWLSHRTDGRANIYIPTRSRQVVGKSSLIQFVNRVFGGDALLMFQHLLDDDNISDEELSEFRKLIDKRKKENRHG